MGSSISKYDDLELATAEGGLEPLPTGLHACIINALMCHLKIHLMGGWVQKETE